MERGGGHSARPAGQTAATRLRSAVRATSIPAMDDQQTITVCLQNIASIDNKTVHYVTLECGGVLLLYRGHKFEILSRAHDGGARYTCSSRLSNGCKAVVHVNKHDAVVYAAAHHNHEPDNYFINLERGTKLLMYRGYTYSKNGMFRGGGDRFVCSSRLSMNCKAIVHVGKHGTIVSATSYHTHDPTKYIQGSAQFINLERGSKLLIYEGYSFARNGMFRKGGDRYTCSSRQSMKCKATVHVDKDGNIVSAASYHTHDPTKYIRVSGGRYIKYINLERGTKLLMYQGYSFAKNGIGRKGGERYTCSSRLTMKCKAIVRVDRYGTIYITLERGSKLLMYQGYSFAKNGMFRKSCERYICSSRISMKCKAIVRVGKDGNIVSAVADHNHDPISIWDDKKPASQLPIQIITLSN
ncbi:Uncharacterized protein OBRU01_19449 [Operophtera brumata]|uniref:FLYWCH-type domain-containing protein n=1 Tax=Operophtera brumata TaxID=104452 RepID=A0A0L7KX54_OPEBR|nr:Uncharacterized protein OBRU01_19449 [Operophtera brumata]